MDAISAFLHFSGRVLEENSSFAKASEDREGIFFSERNSDGEENWIFGIGKKVEADFAKGPFPFFSVTDFLGNKRRFWHFSEFYSSDSELSFTKNPEIEAQLERFQTSWNDQEGVEKYSNETKGSFCEKVKNVQKAEKEGEMWVLNLAHELSGELEDEKSIFGSFLRFLKSDRLHTGGIIWTKEQKFCSFSPEVFLRQKGRKISTFPIKGTGGREDLELSEKEISELHMITDLLRNDLAQIATDVKVDQERFLTDEGNFYHARSEVSAKLINQTLTESDFLKLLPAGSISGAPKHRVVQEILAQESFDRGFYTGTFGVKFSPSESIFNILIRTLFFSLDKGRCPEDRGVLSWRFPVGAGITVESDPEREWDETIEKAKSVLQFFK